MQYIKRYQLEISSLTLLYSILHLLESEEGRYRFEFAENVTIDQFLYSRVVFNTRELHTYCSVLKNGTDRSRIQDLNRQNHLVNVDSNFQDCINFYSSNVTIKNIGFYPMKKYIRCFILNGNPKRCDWEWLDTEKKFRIFANRSSFIQNSFEPFQKYGIENGDMFGVLRCHMKIQYSHGNVKFDIPFVSTHPLKEKLVSTEIKKEAIGVVMIFLVLSILVLLVLLWVNRRRGKRFEKKMKRSRLELVCSKYSYQLSR